MLKFLSHEELMSMYRDVVKYNHYTPVDYDNGIPYTEDELYEEILSRMV